MLSNASRKIVFLDSNEVSLGMVDVDSSEVDVFYALQDADPSQAFLKGLCIVDDIAFFGIAPSSPRSSRADKGLECELAAYDLLNQKLLFRKRLPTNGLLNVVAAPQLAVRISLHAWWRVHLSLVATSARHRSHCSHCSHCSHRSSPQDNSRARQEDSTQRAMVTPHAAFRRAVLGDPGRLAVAARLYNGIQELNIDPDASWSSGWPRIDNRKKNGREGFAGGTQLVLYKADLSALRRRLASIPSEQYDAAYQTEHNAYIGNRESVLERFKPGTKSFHLIFSGRDGHGVFEFPWYAKFADLLEPLLEDLLGEQTSHIMRAQFALMPAHTEIKMHADSGGYSSEGHRIHFVVQSNPDVHFQVCQHEDDCIRLNTEEGLVFELNNRLKVCLLLPTAAGCCRLANAPTRRSPVALCARFSSTRSSIAAIKIGYTSLWMWQRPRGSGRRCKWGSYAGTRGATSSADVVVGGRRGKTAGEWTRGRQAFSSNTGRTTTWCVKRGQTAAGARELAARGLPVDWWAHQ
jgi:hypothetical protein